MSEGTKKRLSDILDSYDARREAARLDEEHRKIEHKDFLESFSNICNEIIRPAMQEIGEQLKARGHDFDISEQSESEERGGRTQNAGITLTVLPRGERSGYSYHGDCPQIDFIACSYKNNVYVHEKTMMPGKGGSACSAGEYELNQITSEIVQEHILKVLSEAMR